MKPNEADYVANRLHLNMNKPGDWIRLSSLLFQGIVPVFYDVEINKLRVEPKR